MSTETPKYTATATATGGRNGHVKSSDGVIDLKISPPKEFGGLEEGHTNPEQLFASGWASCFDNAILLVAKKKRLEIQSKTTVAVTLGLQTNGNMGLSADIKVEITGVDTAVAQKLLDTAHSVCPYSNATKGNVDTKVTLLQLQEN